MLNLKHGLLMKVHYCMKSYRYESRCAEYSTPPDRYFCLYSALPLLLFCLHLSCTQLSLYILCAMCSLIPRLLCLLQPKKKKSFPISYFPISYYEQIFQILLLLLMDCLISPHGLAAFPAGDIKVID